MNRFHKIIPPWSCLAVVGALSLIYFGQQSTAQSVEQSNIDGPVRLSDIAPSSEAPVGSVGVSNMAMRADARLPRITRAKSCTTVTGGTCAVTWDEMATVPLVDPIAMIAIGATQPVPCHPVSGTVTTTGATVKCFASQSILGLGLLPFTTGAAGVTVQVFAIPMTP